jgi:hypothetical protein
MTCALRCLTFAKLTPSGGSQVSYRWHIFLASLDPIKGSEPGAGRQLGTAHQA